MKQILIYISFFTVANLYGQADTLQLNKGIPQLNGFDVKKNRPLDSRYVALINNVAVPFESLTQANSATNTAYRHAGLQKVVTVGGQQQLYWYVNGVADSNLAPIVDWNYMAHKPTLFNGAYSTLTGVPTIPAPDWNATSGANVILNKPNIPNAQIASDWNATSGITAIANKPTIPAQVNLTQGSNILITGTYPNYTITSTASGSGGSSNGGVYTEAVTPVNSIVTTTYPYVHNSVSLYNNGVYQNASFSETTTTTITLNFVPLQGTTFSVTYTKQ